MAIEISNNTLSLIKGGAENTASSRPSPTSSNHSNASDSVVLTSQAEALRDLENQISLVPAVNSQRVAQIQDVIGADNYNISFAQVAEKVIGFETLLNRARS